MGPYVDLATVKQKIADALHVDIANLDPRWDRIVTDAITAGYSDIRNRLLDPRLGYTQDQLDQWDDRTRFNLDQALFWSFVNGAGLGGYSDQDYSKLDHRKELEDEGFALFINGVAAIPGVIATATGSVMGGQMCVPTGDVSELSTFRTQKDRRKAYGNPDWWWGDQNERPGS